MELSVNVVAVLFFSLNMTEKGEWNLTYRSDGGEEMLQVPSASELTLLKERLFWFISLCAEGHLRNWNWRNCDDLTAGKWTPPSYHVSLAEPCTKNNITKTTPSYTVYPSTDVCILHTARFPSHLSFISHGSGSSTQKSQRKCSGCK